MTNLLNRYPQASRKTFPASKEGMAYALLPDRVAGTADDSVTGAPARKLTRPSFDFNLTEHCNLNCCECDHASPLLAKKFASVESFSRDLQALARVFHSKQIRILGGEPLLHPRLTDFLTEARRIDIADSIVLITNGVLLHQAPPEFWRLIDELWISAYPGVKRKLGDEECARLCEAHGVHLKINDYQTFQKTVINNPIADPELIKAIFQDCKNAGEWSCHTVHDGRFYKCSIAPFMGARHALRGVDFDNIPIDGVSLHDNANLYEEVDCCLNGPTPLAACSYCLGTSGPTVAHHQLNRAGRSRWLEEDHSADIEAVRLSLRAKESD
jgi:MoaA/NifB/PqqE/SkfB family radical SAM enzyme